jgi:hypothetical protein
MPERRLLDEVVIAEQGALKTFASYYEGHLNLDNFANMHGEHVMGFTGPETRIVRKRLIATRTLLVQEEAEPQQPEEVVLEPNQAVSLG